ncbi:MAG: 30S ribosome-binding factor RbfA [Patescibacteria group bacterium]
MNNRIERVNSLLERELSKIILRDFEFPIDILVTLTRVEATPNLIEAKAYISVYPEEKTDGTILLLSKSIYDIQYKINRTLRMRPIPKIIFVKEKNISEAGRIEELLNKVKDDLPVNEKD